MRYLKIVFGFTISISFLSTNFAQADSAYYVKSHEQYIGCLHTVNLLWDTFNQNLNEGDCKKIGAKITLPVFLLEFSTAVMILCK